MSVRHDREDPDKMWEMIACHSALARTPTKFPNNRRSAPCSTLTMLVDSHRRRRRSDFQTMGDNKWISGRDSP